MMSGVSTDFDAYVIRLTSSIGKLQDVRQLHDKFEGTFNSLFKWLEEVDEKIGQFAPPSTREDAETLLHGYQVSPD